MIDENRKSANLTRPSWSHDTPPAPRESGFTLLELTIVLLLSALMLGYAGLTFSGYFRRLSAQRAALVFARDLKLARQAALRSRQPVVIRFDEPDLWYEVVEESSGTELVKRRFGKDGDIGLSAIDLRMSGDSVALSSRGVVDLSTAGGGLGEARFSMGTTSYVVFFNSMGASKVERG
ncbi:MAG: prepilin-type N-terminal cleavage/methylation domain-containing protein [Gemmatimonadetes bacterium]|nr:prepilin-type N-terminal cleavage/methylation domain-containing protein [Gemmatimonadota bacterium]